MNNQYEFCFGKPHLESEYFDPIVYNKINNDKIYELMEKFSDIVGEKHLLLVNMYWSHWGIVVTHEGAVNMRLYYPDISYWKYIPDTRFPDISRSPHDPKIVVCNKEPSTIQKTKKIIFDFVSKMLNTHK